MLLKYDRISRRYAISAEKHTALPSDLRMLHVSALTPVFIYFVARRVLSEPYELLLTHSVLTISKSTPSMRIALISFFPTSRSRLNAMAHSGMKYPESETRIGVEMLN